MQAAIAWPVSASDPEGGRAATVLSFAAAGKRKVSNRPKLAFIGKGGTISSLGTDGLDILDDTVPPQ